MTLFEYDGITYGVDLTKVYDQGGVIKLPDGRLIGVVWHPFETYPPPIHSFTPLDPRWIDSAQPVAAGETN